MNAQAPIVGKTAHRGAVPICLQGTRRLKIDPDQSRSACRVHRFEDGLLIALHKSEAGHARRDHRHRRDFTRAQRRARRHGALVALQHWFAQILEGSGGSIDTLMTSISRDRRHRDVQILVYEDIKERQFPDWTLAYNGSAHFVDDGLIEVLAVRTGATLVPYHLHRLIQALPSSPAASTEHWRWRMARTGSACLLSGRRAGLTKACDGRELMPSGFAALSRAARRRPVQLFDESPPEAARTVGRTGLGLSAPCLRRRRCSGTQATL